jgi:hypothetical protein
MFIFTSSSNMVPSWLSIFYWYLSMFFCGKFLHLGDFKKFNENIFSQIPCFVENSLHLILSLSISYHYLIKFHDFADNSQEGMKHQMRGATQAQLGMTLRIV